MTLTYFRIKSPDVFWDHLLEMKFENSQNII